MNIPFIQAANFTPANRTRIDLIVLHSMENSEKPRAARNVAEWFAGADAPPASAHYCLDAVETIQCVREQDVAWAAPGANHTGIQIEHAGRADQTASQWSDPFSTAMLAQSVMLCADVCARWSIPAQFVTFNGLRAGKRGITTHYHVTLAFRKSTHTDPGPGFPTEWFVAQVAARLAARAVKSAASEVL